jgi:NAD(P)-dependent dehydrogenase (short-subunit alcohol dehydrogenase family)
MDELRFDGRVVAITGGHHGLGREYALLLARRGAKVVVNDLQGAAETVDAITSAGGEAIENTADITTAAGTDTIVDDACRAWGRLDAIVNNAAGGDARTFADEAAALVTIGVHFFGTVNLVRSALPVFREQRYGRIVNTTSGSIFGIAGPGMYAAGKGAVFAFSRVLANELRQEPDVDIKVNAVMPTAQTPIMPRVPDEQFQAMLDSAFAPARVAPLVALLVHESCPVAGETLQSGGGRVSRVVLATTEGWQAPDDDLSPEAIAAHWPDVMANRDLQEPVGTMADLLGRRGEPPYSMADIFRWARTGIAEVWRG